MQEAGRGPGLEDGGVFAVNAMRMEKGYRHWGHDIGFEDTPFQAGLDLAVAMACQRHPVEVQFGPRFDPRGERPKA
jgi:glycine cleavage system aminomethyltransferase T